MFSWNCLACGFSLRECRGCSEDNWMAQAVVLAPNGTRVIGFYNSYGQVGDTYNLAEQMGDFSVYHKACWELVGKPEFTRQSPHARDQGFCHQMHGTPFPLPTLEWMELAKMWHAVDRVLQAYGQLRCDIDHDNAERMWNSLTPERQLACCNEFDAAKNALKERNRAKWEAYLHSPHDEELSPEKEPDPTHYMFDGLNFDYMWLNHFIRMAKKDY